MDRPRCYRGRGLGFGWVEEPDQRRIGGTRQDVHERGGGDDAHRRRGERSGAHGRAVRVRAVVVSLDVLLVRISISLDDVAAAEIIRARVFVDERGRVFVVLVGIRQLSGDRFRGTGTHHSQHHEGRESTGASPHIHTQSLTGFPGWDR